MLMWFFFGTLQASGYMEWMESLGVESVLVSDEEISEGGGVKDASIVDRDEVSHALVLARFLGQSLGGAPVIGFQ